MKYAAFKFFSFSRLRVLLDLRICTLSFLHFLLRFFFCLFGPPVPFFFLICGLAHAIPERREAPATTANLKSVKGERSLKKGVEVSTNSFFFFGGSIVATEEKHSLPSKE